MGLYEIENISNGNICKIVRRDTKGMNFESYAKRIETLKKSDGVRNKKRIVEKSLQVTNTEMKMPTHSTIC